MIHNNNRGNGLIGAGALAIPILAVILASGAPVLAQEAQSQTQTHQLRANVAIARSIAPEVAKRYGIDQGPRSALVDVVVTRIGSHETVPATIQVRATNLAGQTTWVPMRAMTEAGQTSYLGVYRFLPDEVTDFDVVAKPDNAGTELSAHVREHFPAD